MSKINNSKKIITKRISEVAYEGPQKTYTQSLTKEKIALMLSDYDEIEFDKLETGNNVRYWHFNEDKNMYEFKIGGLIIVKKDDHIVLSSKITWSVQKKNNIFYRKMSSSQIAKMIETKYKDIIIDKEMKIKELISYIKKLENLLKNK